MKSNQRVPPEQQAEIDLTPMLDVVFIMLIFFIVTTSFVKEDGIVLNRPAANPPETPNESPTRPILIEINENSEVSIKGRLIDVKAIEANVQSARAKSPKALVIVRAHESATAGTVISAVDQARLAGADKVTVVKP